MRGGGGVTTRTPVTPITTPVFNKRRAPPVSLRNMNVRGNQMIQQIPVVTPPPNRSTNRQPVTNRQPLTNRQIGNTNRQANNTEDISRAPVTSKQWHTAFNQTGSQTYGQTNRQTNRHTNGQTNGQTDRMVPNRSGARRPMNGGLGNKPITPILNIRCPSYPFNKTSYLVLRLQPQSHFLRRPRINHRDPCSKERKTALSVLHRYIRNLWCVPEQKDIIKFYTPFDSAVMRPERDEEVSSSEAWHCYKVSEVFQKSTSTIFSQDTLDDDSEESEVMSFHEWETRRRREDATTHGIDQLESSCCSDELSEGDDGIPADDQDPEKLGHETEGSVKLQQETESELVADPISTSSVSKEKDSGNFSQNYTSPDSEDSEFAVMKRLQEIVEEEVRDEVSPEKEDELELVDLISEEMLERELRLISLSTSSDDHSSDKEFRALALTPTDREVLSRLGSVTPTNNNNLLSAPGMQWPDDEGVASGFNGEREASVDNSVEKESLKEKQELETGEKEQSPPSEVEQFSQIINPVGETVETPTTIPEPVEPDSQTPIPELSSKCESVNEVPSVEDPVPSETPQITPTSETKNRNRSVSEVPAVRKETTKERIARIAAEYNRNRSHSEACDQHRRDRPNAVAFFFDLSTSTSNLNSSDEASERIVQNDSTPPNFSHDKSPELHDRPVDSVFGEISLVERSVLPSEVSPGPGTRESSPGDPTIRSFEGATIGSLNSDSVERMDDGNIDATQENEKISPVSVVSKATEKEISNEGQDAKSHSEKTEELQKEEVDENSVSESDTTRSDIPALNKICKLSVKDGSSEEVRSLRDENSLKDVESLKDQDSLTENSFEPSPDRFDSGRSAHYISPERCGSMSSTMTKISPERSGVLPRVVCLQSQERLTTPYSDDSPELQLTVPDNEMELTVPDSLEDGRLEDQHVGHSGRFIEKGEGSDTDNDGSLKSDLISSDLKHSEPEPNNELYVSEDLYSDQYSEEPNNINSLKQEGLLYNGGQDSDDILTGDLLSESSEVEGKLYDSEGRDAQGRLYGEVSSRDEGRYERMGSRDESYTDYTDYTGCYTDEQATYNTTDQDVSEVAPLDHHNISRFAPLPAIRPLRTSFSAGTLAFLRKQGNDLEERSEPED
eukprot:sb/3461331/